MKKKRKRPPPSPNPPPPDITPFCPVLNNFSMSMFTYCASFYLTLVCCLFTCYCVYQFVHACILIVSSRAQLLQLLR